MISFLYFRMSDENKEIFEITEDMNPKLESCFKYFDRDHDGLITKAEFQESLQAFGNDLTDVEVDAIFPEGKDCVNLEEFKQLIAENYTNLSTVLKSMVANFKIFDANNDGFLTMDELRLALQHKNEISEEDLEQLFKEIDTNEDGLIDIVEFVKFTFCKTEWCLEKGLIQEAE